MEPSRVRLTNAEKVLYPRDGTTKADVFGYYTAVAEVMLPHLAGRPVTRKRWPDGVGADWFFEKQLPASAPAWLTRGEIVHKTRTSSYPIIDSADGLAWAAQQAALELHVPQWRFVGGKPGPATRLVFDLDPGEHVGLAQLAEVARSIRDLLAGIGLTAFPVTSGSSGLHLYAPLDRPISSAGAVTLARRIADQLQRDAPDRITATMTKSARAGRVFVDWSQNNAAKTTCSPYSLRGRPEPTVAAPRTWAELDDPALRQLRYDEVLARVDRDGDLLAPLDDRHRRPTRRSRPSPAAPAGPGADGDSAPATDAAADADGDLDRFEFARLTPMLAGDGPVAEMTPDRWAFEGKFDGYRMLVDADHGGLRLRSRGGVDVTADFPSLQPLSDQLAGHRAVLDGEVVALDASGVPSFAALQHRDPAAPIEFWAFDLLYLDGRPLLRASYRDRRTLLAALGERTGLIVPDLLPGDGAAALNTARARRWEGVVAKRWDSVYLPGRRPRTWIKDKLWNAQEVVIGGWRRGARSSGIGALLAGIPRNGALDFIGKVGTGFSERDLAHLKEILEPLRADESPFGATLPGRDAEGVTFVRPVLVGEVRYRDWTTSGRLRHPSWRGLRPDKTAAAVVRE